MGFEYYNVKCRHKQNIDKTSILSYTIKDYEKRCPHVFITTKCDPSEMLTHGLFYTSVITNFSRLATAVNIGQKDNNSMLN